MCKIVCPDVVKNLNVKVFNLVSGTNETRRIEWHEMCNCKCRFNSGVCNNIQCWNDDKCRCECKELIDKDVCDKGFFWNPSNCECECYESCDFSEYLDYKNCKCKKCLADKLAEKCTENFERRLVEITTAKSENKQKCSSCTLCIVYFQYSLQLMLELVAIFFIFIGT